MDLDIREFKRSGGRTPIWNTPEANGKQSPVHFIGGRFAIVPAIGNLYG
jgi:hypothetical protein